jgi:hypothetical protein
MIGAITAGLFSAGAPPIAPNSYESIATVTVGGGGTSTISFTSIPSTFKHLQLRFSQLGTYGQFGKLTFNSDTSNSYFWHGLYGNGSSAVATAYGSAVGYAYMPFNTGGTSNPCVGVLDILDYTNTNKYKVSRSLEGSDQNGSGTVSLSSFNWSNTAAINRIDIVGQGTSWNQYSSFALYGIKG